MLNMLPHVLVARVRGSPQGQGDSSAIGKQSATVSKRRVRYTFISDTAFMNVLLMPSASPRSSKPFANSGKFNCPLAARPSDPRLLCPESGGSGRVSDALFRRPLRRSPLLRDARDGGSGTSVGRLSRLWFSKIIDSPTTAVGDIWSVKA